MFLSSTDLTSMAIMSKLEIGEILAGDAHFAHVGMGFRRIPSRKER